MGRSRIKATAAVATIAAVSAARARAPRRQDDLTGEVAVVTGASRGLGLILARELAAQSCRLVICARDAKELGRAEDQLRQQGADVLAVACDLAEEDAAQQLIDAAIGHFGRIDILVNNAGEIRVGPAASAAPQDYESALRIMTMAPVRTAYAALPHMRARQHGRIVTITSIGGKVSVPHLIPYSVAKFGAVAFSEGLRAELGSGPVTVTTVVPGLMRTGSHERAAFGGRRDAEYTWFALAASLPVLSMDAENAARQIVTAVRQRRAEVILTPAGQVVARSAAIAPGLTAAALHLATALLPAPEGRQGQDSGLTLRPAMSSALFGWLTTQGRRAAERFNELPGQPPEVHQRALRCRRLAAPRQA
jgi:short-subunit dehydrogenase